ncbi:hypothetical protein INT44_007352 [Umbelopsis vinacea]|uniref:EamA domain-containing protein n=1 Tax=Umbelopsis vinacea TaxID=44442 RepID=A0A8H7PMG3_9FUNG|nr:hypothetical protein INT44_007352 [Umbelopsis vinacea]
MTDASPPVPVAGSRRRYTLGIVALLLVVVIWVSSSFVMNSIFGEQSYNKPFLITYINTASFSFYLLPFLLKKKLSNKKTNFVDELRDSVPIERAQSTSMATNDQEALGETSLFLRTDSENNQAHDEVNYGSPPADKLSTKETIQLSLTFCIVWFLANWSTNASLAYTTVGSSTILSSMSGLFTLGIGAMFGIERINGLKIAAVFISLIGVSLVSYADKNASSLPIESPSSPSNPLLGDILALLGAFFYGCYTILLKIRIQDESRLDMSLFFGFVGAFNVVLLWPCFGILHALGIERLELPSTGAVWGLILLNALIGTFLSDYLWLLAMLMTSPLVVTLGLSLTIPVALTGDFVFKHVVPNLQYWAGAILVIAGFLSVNMAALSEVEEAEILEGRQLVPQEDPLETSLESRHIIYNQNIPKGSQNSLNSTGSYHSMDQTTPR